MMEVVAMARMVPTGMDFWASRKSPERFEPAMMPGGERRDMDVKQTGSKRLFVDYDTLLLYFCSHR